jgi:magnesium transporter
MMTLFKNDFLDRTVREYYHQDYVRLNENMTIGQAIGHLQQCDLNERIMYLYAVDGEDRLVGVVPIRRLLGGSMETRISEVMIRKLVTVPCDATMEQAGDVLLRHKLLAVPAITSDGKIAGVVDMNQFTEGSLTLGHKAQLDSMFQLMGLHLSLGRKASPWLMFKERFPWLLCNVASGILCAIVTAQYELLIQEIMVLAMFMTVVLALGESVSMQAMTITVQRLQLGSFSWKAVMDPLRREGLVSLMLAAGCGSIIGLTAFVWKGGGWVSFAMGFSLILSILSAGLLGVVIPSLIKAFRIDPKVAAGPVVLACADVCTLLFYFNMMNVIAH